MTTTLATEPIEHHPLAPLVARMVGDEKHQLSALGTLHVVSALYERVLRIDPSDPSAPDRDRFLVSKGHGPMAYFAALARKGFFDEAWLDTFLHFHGRLGGHPDRTLVPGVEISSGSLGHGLPIAVGMALGLRAQGTSGPRIFCLLGDGELDEGSNHEAIAFAGRAYLSSLTAIVIDNQSSSHGWPGGIGRRFRVEGWSVTNVDGRDENALVEVLERRSERRPRAIVARVDTKGS